jgi:D-alanyl-lipoteichoic acid acyltransferase DltB (MBOAT superfamily)
MGAGVRRLRDKMRVKTPRIEPGIARAVLRLLATFHLVLLGWVFFRANSLGDAFLLLRNGFPSLLEFLVDALDMRIGSGYLVDDAAGHAAVAGKHPVHVPDQILR